MTKKIIVKKKKEEVLEDEYEEQEIYEEEEEYEEDYEEEDEYEDDEEDSEQVKDLWSIVDRNRPYSLIYSGVENPQYFNLLYSMGVRNFLMSYHYIHGKKLDMTTYRDKGIKFFIDSGVYTFVSNEEYHDLPKEHWEEHIVNYLAWARENKDVIFAIANMDMEILFDKETVDEWNEKYFEPFMIETGIPVCFIWHQERGMDGWEEYCQRYPFTGFSWVSESATGDGFEYGNKLLRIAQKYGSVCHGMGMTRTSLLTKLPFYTSDSTTWLVGLQYGEVNYWTGKKMTRLKKDKWKGEYLNDLVAYGLDRDKLLNEDKEEMIKANVIAFIEAEKFIHQKLKSKMYWLKPQKVQNHVSTFKFPSYEWCNGDSDYEGWQEIARLMNINPDLDEDDGVDYIIDCTVMLNWENEEYQPLIEETFDEEHLRNIHRFYVNTVKVNVEDIIEDLQEFFKDVLEGRNEKLLLIGTDFDRVSKERENYLEEDEYETLDVSPQEYTEQVQHLLPANLDEAPEIEELDKEIFDQTGYIAVRDEKGRFVKGQKRVRKRKNMYSDLYPKLACNTCYAAQSCPEYKEGYVCAYNKMFKRFDSRNSEDILDAMSSMVNLNMERMQREAIFEMLDGGTSSSVLTQMIDQNMRLLQQMQEVQQAHEVIRQTRVMRSDGTMEQTTQVSSNAPGGVMEMLMKQMMNRPSSNEDTMDEINTEL